MEHSRKGRPPSIRRVSTRSISMYPEEWEAIDERAYGKKLTRSDYIRKAVEAYALVESPPSKRAALAS
jgi:hypothetical protein